MAITVQLIGPDENIVEHAVASGDSVAVAADQRVILPEIQEATATLEINPGDVLTITAGSQSFELPGVVSNIENETGTELVFGDGATIDSLGSLLARTALAGDDATSARIAGEMADLVHDDAHGGDLFYVDDLAASEVMTLANSMVGEVLQLGELVDIASGGDELFGADSGDAGQNFAGHLNSDLWASTESRNGVSDHVPHHHDDADIFDMLLTGDDGLS